MTPGKTYRYRVRFELANPNFGRRLEDAGGLQHVVDPETLQTPWSNITETVSVPDELQYFVLDVQDLSNRIFPWARFDVFQYDTEHGTFMNKLRHVLGGDALERTQVEDAFVRDEAVAAVERREMFFESLGNVIRIEDGELRRLGQSVRAHHRDIHPRDGENARAAPRRG
jgi:hypothetical protein